MDLKIKIEALKEKNKTFINIQKTYSNEIIDILLNLMDKIHENTNIDINSDQVLKNKIINSETNNGIEKDFKNNEVILETIGYTNQDLIIDEMLKDNENLKYDEIDINKIESNFANIDDSKLEKNSESNNSYLKIEENNSIRKVMTHNEIIQIENFKFIEQIQETDNVGFDFNLNVLDLKDTDDVVLEPNTKILNQIEQKEIQQIPLISEKKNIIADIMNNKSVISSRSENKNNSENEEEIEDYLNIALLDDIIFELKNHPDIGIVVDNDGMIIHYNHSFVSRLKFTPTECINTNIKTLIHFDDHDLFSSTFQKLVHDIQSRTSNENSNANSNANFNSVSFNNNNKVTIKPIIINISDKFKTFKKYNLSFESSNINSNTIIENKNYIKIRLLKYIQEENYQYICPKSSQQFIWSIILSLFLFYLCWETTYNFAFNSIIINHNNQIFNIALTTVFLIDLIQNFFVGFETTEDNIESNNLNIIQNQLTTFFIIDLISTFPFELLDNVNIKTQNLKLIKFVKIVKLFRLAKIYPTINSLNQLSKQEQFLEFAIFIKANIGFIELIKVVTFLLILTHFQTCIYFQYKTVYQQYQNLNWTFLQFNQSQEDKSAFEIYMKVQSEMLKTSLGLNSVQASEPLEIFMDTTWIIIGLSIFGYGIGNISSYLTNANKRENEQNETVKFFRELQEDHECEYLGAIIENDIKDQQNNYSINEFNKQSQMLSENIKTQIDNAIQSNFIKLHPIFNNLNIQSVKKLKQSKIKSDKYIVRSNEVMNSIQFVLKGSIKVMNINLCMINEQFTGEIFGMNHFTEQYSKKFQIDLHQFLVSDDSKKKKMKKSSEETSKKLLHQLSEKINDNFLMIYHDIIIKCEYQAICTHDTLQMEIDYKNLEEILKSDLDSFRKIQKHSYNSFELINNKEYQLSKIAYEKFESSNMIGIMIKSSGYIQDLNIESRKQITELGSTYHDINFIKCLYKIDSKENKTMKPIIGKNETKLGEYILEIEQTKQNLELIEINEAKIARTDIDSTQYKLKKSLQDVKILQFKLI